MKRYVFFSKVTVSQQHTIPHCIENDKKTCTERATNLTKKPNTAQRPDVMKMFRWLWLDSTVKAT